MSGHLKRYAAPKSWFLLRKMYKWVTRPAPGPHPLMQAVPIALLLKKLGLARTKREIKKILNAGFVLVDGRRIANPHFPVGFMDVLEIKQAAQTLRVVIDRKGKLQLLTIPTEEAGKKVCKITGKTTVKKGKTQLNLFDGRNLLIDKNGLAVGDSVLITIPKMKIIEPLKLEKGFTIYLVGGKHIGDIGVVAEIKGNTIWYQNEKKRRLETLKKFAFVVGKEKPSIKIK